MSEDKRKNCGFTVIIALKNQK